MDKGLGLASIAIGYADCGRKSGFLFEKRQRVDNWEHSLTSLVRRSIHTRTRAWNTWCEGRLSRSTIENWCWPRPYQWISPSQRLLLIEVEGFWAQPWMFRNFFKACFRTSAHGCWKHPSRCRIRFPDFQEQRRIASVFPRK